MREHTEITDRGLDIDQLVYALRDGHTISISGDCAIRIGAGRDFLERATLTEGKMYYGVNTGFGSLYHVKISNDATERLQQNLVRSHAAGSGPLVPFWIARAALLLKIVSFCPGNSGVRLELVETLISVFNAGLAPAMHLYGSLGASGDLAPLAHMALAVMGEGEFVDREGEVHAAGPLLDQHGIRPLTLQSKEGLALINGTQFSCAYAVWAVHRVSQLISLASISGAMSLDAFNGNPHPFDERIQAIRPHPGQIAVAAQIRRLLDGSEIANQGEKELQDPYAFRCIPQVHGASLDALDHCRRIVETEMSSVTDNPLVFPGSEEVISGGNFHGQPLALAMDYLAIAAAELGSISERRCYQLLTGARGLPEYLTLEAGVQSGLMIAQYTAASLVNRNKILCTPASIDSIPTSKGQEDHVSMSANAASKLYELCDNVHAVLAIEFLTAARALDFRAPMKTSPFLEQLRKSFLEMHQLDEHDFFLSPVMRAAKDYTRSLEIPE